MIPAAQRINIVAPNKVAPAPDGERPLAGGYRHNQGEGALTSGAAALSVANFGEVPENGKANGKDGPPKTLRPEEPPPFVDRLSFNLFVTLTTFLNILLIGLEQDMGPRGGGISDRFAWYMMECGLLLCFAVELGGRVYCGGRKFFLGLWNVLDFLLVAASLVDSFALKPAGVSAQVRLFTVVRGLRIVRLVQLVRMFRTFRELWLLVGGFVNSLKALGWVGLVVILVLYVGSIVVTTEIGQNDKYAEGPSWDGEIWPYKKYFGSVWRSMFTLFQIITLDCWCDDIVRHVVYRQPAMGVFFMVFLLITAFGLMNVVVGIILENTLAAAQVADRRVEETKAVTRKDAVDQLFQILEKSDSLRTGEISLEELRAAHQSRIVQEKFEAMELTFDEVHEIFRLLDYNQSGRVELKRFAGACRELVGGAKRRDIGQVEVTVGALAQHLERLDGRFAQIEAEVNSLTTCAEEFMQTTVRLLTGFDGTHAPPTRIQ